jgi:hypothetical protein
MLFARRVLCGDQQVVALCLELCLTGNDLCADGLGGRGAWGTMNAAASDQASSLG